MIKAYNVYETCTYKTVPTLTKCVFLDLDNQYKTF